jgi:hypothetical protein
MESLQGYKSRLGKFLLINGLHCKYIDFQQTTDFLSCLLIILVALKGHGTAFMGFLFLDAAAMRFISESFILTFGDTLMERRASVRLTRLMSVYLTLC